MLERWQPVIGLEIHTQLATQSKMFSGAATAYGAEPNTQAAALDLGMPGMLPVPNREAIRMALTFGAAIDAEIAPRSVFARKNYFYPDLPKGYQISQFELPIVAAGHLVVRRDDGSVFDVAITRAHLEEDAGKSLHDAFHNATGLDLNRAGVPLLEIVSEPVLHSAADAVAYMKAVHRLVRWLGICDGNMQEGSFRCDANVSVRPRGSSTLGTRTEIKNVNSFRFVEKAIEYEIERQVRELENGGKIVQETRLYDAAAHRTRPMRSKEEANDYRYFPDPDLPPLLVSKGAIDSVRANLPELPERRRTRFIEALGLSEYDAGALTAELALADYFEALLGHVPGQAKLCANWVLGELAAVLNAENLDIAQSRVAPEALAGLLIRVQDGTISGKMGKTVFAALWSGAGSADAIIAAQGLGQISDDSALLAAVDAVLAQQAQQVAKFRAGDEKVFQFFVGQVMKALRGKANPQRLNELLRERLGSANASLLPACGEKVPKADEGPATN